MAGRGVFHGWVRFKRIKIFPSERRYEPNAISYGEKELKVHLGY